MEGAVAPAATPRQSECPVARPRKAEVGRDVAWRKGPGDHRLHLQHTKAFIQIVVLDVQLVVPVRLRHEAVGPGLPLAALLLQLPEPKLRQSVSQTSLPWQSRRQRQTTLRRPGRRRHVMHPLADRQFLRPVVRRVVLAVQVRPVADVTIAVRD